MVFCFSFLRRSDAPMDWSETWVVQHWPSRIDPILLLGVSTSDFPCVGQPHEALCARSLRASMGMFVPPAPKLIEGLGMTQWEILIQGDGLTRRFAVGRKKVAPDLHPIRPAVPAGQ